MDRNFVEQAKKSVKGMMADKSVLVRYMRNKKGQPYGVVVGVKTDDGVVIGHSRCNTKADNFNRYVGVHIAVQRALKGEVVGRVDNELVGWYNRMAARAAKYFKDVPANA